MNQELIKNFQNPSAKYRGKPFWSWNGKLEKKELLRQIDVLKEMGMGGYFCHSRTGLSTEYLGAEWFDIINACAEKGEKLGMETWLYDEDRWPSGTAGGMVTEKPEYRMRYIRLRILKGDTFQYDKNCLASFAVDLDGMSFRNKKRLTGTEGAAGRTVLQFTIEEMGKSEFYNGYTYVDTMNEEATRYYIDLTHEKYKENCGDRLGKSILGIFTDEPNRGAVMDAFSLNNEDATYLTPYTAKLADEFRKRYGTDLIENLPELFLWKNGEKVHPVKWQYMELIEEFFLHNFLEPIHDWCKNNHMLLTGHLLHEDSLTAQSSMIGSILRGYEFLDCPGVDVLTEHNYGFWIVKQLQSAARQLGKDKLLSELYGATGWQFNFESHKDVGDWQALFGINMRCHHLSWYSMQGEAKRDYPASISGQSAWYREYSYVEDYFSRIHALTSQGKPLCDLLVLYPVESVWMQIYPGWSVNLGPVDKDICALEARYQQTFHMLCGNRIDFDYGDEDFLHRFGEVVTKDGKPALKVGKAVYHTVLVSGMQTMRSSTLKLLKEFIAAGGNVVFAGEAPSYIDAGKSQEASKLGAVYTEFSEKDVLNALKVTPAVTVKTSDGTIIKKIFAQVRKNGEDIICHLLNIDRVQAFRGATVEIEGSGNCERWDARTGEIGLIAKGSGKISFQYDFEPAQELLLVVTPENRNLKPVEHAPARRNTVSCGECFRYSLDEPNVCVLDFVNFRAGDGSWRMNREILKADQEIRRQFGLPLRSGEMIQPWYAKKTEQKPVASVKLNYLFSIETVPDKIKLAVESPEEFEILVNDKKALKKTNDFWVDACFTVFEIDNSALKTGQNKITLLTEMRQDINLEAIYLLGEFGVAAEKNRATLTKLPKMLHLGDLSEQGLPFYGAGVTYYADAPETAAGERLLLETEGYDAACVRVSGGENSKMIAFRPYRADVTELVSSKKEIAVRYILTRRNTFGPLHQNPVICGAYGPGNFTTTGNGFLPKSYGLIKQGMTFPLNWVIESGKED